MDSIGSVLFVGCSVGIKEMHKRERSQNGVSQIQWVVVYKINLEIKYISKILNSFLNTFYVCVLSLIHI